MIVGGYANGYSLSSDVEIVDPMSSDVSFSKPMDYPITAVGMVAMSYKNAPLVCGGYDDSSGYTKRCYSFKAKRWEEHSSLMKKRAWASSVKLKNYFWITGGDGDWDASLLTSEMMSLETGKFTTGPRLPERMQYHCSAVVNDTHLFIAGNTDYGNRMAYLVDTTTSTFKFKKLPGM